jgi:RHS repeat-associated protein
LQYLPFGELHIDQRVISWHARYTFSGKEKDEESPYSYFGARYYDSDLSIWISVDPLASMYPGLTPYAYCSNDPINRIDPDGNWDIDVHAYRDKSQSGYAVLIVRDRAGNEVYLTVVKTIC